MGSASGMYSKAQCHSIFAIGQFIVKFKQSNVYKLPIKPPMMRGCGKLTPIIVSCVPEPWILSEILSNMIKTQKA